MKKLIINILTQVGTFASLIGLLFTLYNDIGDFKSLQWFLFFLALLLLIISLWIVIDDYNKSMPLKFKNRQEIKNYMYNWIEGSGNTLIFTRDLSWVEDDKMKNMLRSKSSNHDLIICLPKRIQKVEEFEALGAQIIEYSAFNYVSSSRFTIANYGRNDAKIAIGKTISEHEHLIEEYKNGDHPFFNVAHDLVSLITKFNES